MSGRKFKLRSGSDSLTEREKFSKMKNKLGSFIEKHEENAACFSKFLLESKLLGSEELDVTEVKDLMDMSKKARLDCEEESEKLSSQNLREIEALTELHVVACEENIKKVMEGSSNYEKTWLLKMQPDKNSFPEIIVTQELATIEHATTAELPEITKLKIDIEGLDSDEIDGLLRFCENNLEPQLVIRLVQEYLPLNLSRQEIFNNSSTSKHCSPRSSNIMEFINSAGSVLANICFVINFDERGLCWSPKWMCKLTDAGTEACNTFNLPSELVRTGTVSTWDWNKVVETMAKVARLDTDSPTKSDAGACDFSNLDINTPMLKGEELKKKIPKRKLN